MKGDIVVKRGGGGYGGNNQWLGGFLKSFYLLLKINYSKIFKHKHLLIKIFLYTFCCCCCYCKSKWSVLLLK